MVVDMMRRSDDENEIYCLLTAYIDAARFCRKGNFLPEPVMRLPMEGVADVRWRFETLMGELDAASRRLDDNACLVVRDALNTFGTALECLHRTTRADGHRLMPVAAQGLVGGAQAPDRQAT